MFSGLPKDPVMLVSVVNTKLRDFYGSLDELCDDMQLDRDELVGKFKSVDYVYDKKRNQFV